ncbi:kidins220 [Symbiodinium natans]|uniref:Kidins220 protein n=1 Tax=Symbiodinium natans TaxID=878477 RepID=A0A812PGY3_9DINO|nr:kidins220 [Symbiodinium natans]
MVVDENTVMVTSPIAFKSKYGQVHGEVHSEMWVRAEDKMTWKIRSAMVSLQDLGHSEASTPTAQPAAPPAAQPAAQPEKQREAPATGTPPATPAPKESRPKDTVLSGDVNSTMGASGPSGTEQVARGHSTFLAGLGVLAAVSVGAVLVRRAQNRRAAAISGFESMLG